MNYKNSKSFFPVLFIAIFLISSCSTPSWFTIKKGVSQKAKLNELLDKEIIIIEGKEYVKVINKDFTQGGKGLKYLYIPIDEYLSNRNKYLIPTLTKEKEKREVSSGTFSQDLQKEALVKASEPLDSNLKRKVLVSYFDDRTSQKEEILGDWITERLKKEVNKRSKDVIFVDYQLVKDFLLQRGINIEELEKAEVLKLLNGIFGVHLIIKGELSGPYIFKVKRDKESYSSSILKIELKLINTSSGKIYKTLHSINPIISTKEYGAFSEEKAKSKAIDLCIAELSKSFIEEIGKIEWFCRIAKIEENDVYINAGKLSGIKPGDVLDIFSPGQYGTKMEAKGKIKITNLFGIDASMGRLIQGERPEMDDILRLAKIK